MSEVIEQSAPAGQPVTVEDLQRMLDEQRGRTAEVERERDTERSTRIQTEAERDAERAARLVTETERDGHAARIGTEAEQRWAAERDAAKNGIDAQKSTLTSAKQAYARHAEEGNWSAAADAQEVMVQAGARLAQLEAKAEFLDTNKERLVAPPPKTESREVRPAAPPTDRIGQLVRDVLPAERTWIEKRPKFLDDAGYRAQVFDASNFASKRFTRGTDGYFREIERVLGESETQSPRPSASANGHDRAPSADLAPQRRASPGQQPQGGGQEWRLSADEAEIADGLYGQQNQPDYIADQPTRYRHYWEMKEKLRQSGRL